ncbi:MAG: MBL fold metallo-hydrolase, partial [Actinoplanes sp.]
MSWSIWILEYGYVDRFPASNLFAAQPNEGHRRMPYCFGLLRSAERSVLVDVGFADQNIYDRLTAKYGETRWRAPVDVLARAGLDTGDIDTILLTHNHFDHAGCVAAFPDAHVWIQRREIDSYVAAARKPGRFEFLTRSCQADLPAHLAAR